MIVGVKFGNLILIHNSGNSVEILIPAINNSLRQIYNFYLSISVNKPKQNGNNNRKLGRQSIMSADQKGLESAEDGKSV